MLQSRTISSLENSGSLVLVSEEHVKNTCSCAKITYYKENKIKQYQLRKR